MDKYIKFTICVILTFVVFVLFWALFGPFICLWLIAS